MEQHQAYERYQRQIILKEFGYEGQYKLSRSKVLVVGAGGLGCPVLQYLAAAGVGTIGIVDDDLVSLSNLHRQVLYNMDDIGKPKSLTAINTLQQLNPQVQFIPYNTRLNNQNALGILKSYDIVVDGTDNFSSRYMINDACIVLNKVLVYGAVSRFEGQVSVFNHEENGKRSAGYRDLFPDAPNEGEIMNCAEGGVLGVLPGIVGSMQANEVIKLVTGIGQPLANRLLIYNALTNQVYELGFSSTTQKVLSEEAFLNRMYDAGCTSVQNFEITNDEFNALLEEENITIIDVREKGEVPLINGFDHLQIPLSQWPQKISSLEGHTIITFCQTGQRSLKAASLLFDTFGTAKKVHSLKGGITRWLNHQ